MKAPASRLSVPQTGGIRLPDTGGRTSMKKI